jgi:hypothetical protein
MDKEKKILGKTAAPFLISSRKENCDTLLDMLRQAHQDLVIFSHNLDGPLYDTSEFTDTVRKLSLDNKNSKVRILIQELDFLIKHGHRIVELARRLPTSIEIRHADSRFEHVNTCYSIVDHKGVILRNDAYRFDAKADYHDPRLALELTKQFDEMWEQSEPSTEMHRLHI